MVWILLAGFHTTGAIRYASFVVMAAVWAAIFAVGAVRVAVAGDWIDATLLILLAAGLLFSAWRYYKIAKKAVLAAAGRQRLT